MLNDPSERWSADEALESEWILSCRKNKLPLIRRLSAKEEAATSEDNSPNGSPYRRKLGNHSSPVGKETNGANGRMRGMSKSVHDEPIDNVTDGFEGISEQAPDQIIFKTQVNEFESSN